MEAGFYWIRHLEHDAQWTVAEVVVIITDYRGAEEKRVRWLGSDDEVGLQKALDLGWSFGQKIEAPLSRDTRFDPARSDMAILMCGYLAGMVMRPQFREHFKLREVKLGPQTEGSPPAFFDIVFQSGTTVRIRPEDV